MKPSKFSLRLILLAMAIPAIGLHLNAQRGYYFYDNGSYQSDLTLELGVRGGLMNGMTDIGGSKKGIANSGFFYDFTTKNTKLYGGLFLTATYRDFIGLRLSVNAGSLEAADSNLKGTTNSFAEGRYDRNLSFKTKLFEITAGLEFHPLMLRDYDNEPPRFSPYVLADIGIVNFNPRTELNGVWYNLEPLRLEGQGFAEYPDRKRYKKTAWQVPLGIGVRYELNDLIYLRAEVARHFTFTDYLDDVSQGDWVDPSLFYKYLSPSQADIATQLYNRSPKISPPHNTRPRGNPNDNDAFWTLNLKIGFNLNRLGGNNRGYEFR